MVTPYRRPGAPHGPLVPLASPVQQALAGHPVLAQLQARIAASRQCLALVTDLLPPGLHASVQAGPIEDGAWTLLVAHAGGAAKLRQLLPLIESRLLERGAEVTSVRVRIQRTSPIVTNGG